MKKRVFESLNNAIANGYDLEGWSSDQIAQDLSDYDSYFEDKNPVDIEPFVKEWQESRKK